MILRPVHLKGFSALAAGTILLLLLTFLIKGLPSAVSYLIFWAGVQSAFAFHGFLWALERSNEAFFSIFVGDALLRLLTLGLAAVILWRFHISYTAPLLALAMAYLVLSLVQIPFLHKAA